MLRRLLKIAGLAVALGLMALLVVLALPIRPTVPKLQPRDSTRYWVDGVMLSLTLEDGVLRCLAARLSRTEFARRVG